MATTPKKKKTTPKDVGKRQVNGQTEFFQPSSGKSLTREQFVEANQSRNFNVNAKTGLTKAEFESTTRRPAEFNKTLANPENIRQNVGLEQRTPTQQGIIAATPEAQFLAEQEFFQEQPPERTDLDIPEQGILEKAPVLGASIGAGTGILQNAADQGWLGSVGNAQPEDPIIQNPETQREMALQEIQKEVIKEGLTAGESFGAIIEAIPVVGSLAGKYASGLIEDPKGNVDAILAEIDSERERSSVIAEKVMTGRLGNPLVAFEQIEDIEDNLARLEQRIKILSQTSAQLRADPDSLNRIEEKILRSKERVFIAKQLAAGGVVETATDSSLYLELQSYKT